jgi:hypothetical protein
MISAFFLLLVLTISLQCHDEVLSRVHKWKKAVMCLIEKVNESNKLNLGMMYNNTLGNELRVNNIK